MSEELPPQGTCLETGPSAVICLQDLRDSASTYSEEAVLGLRHVVRALEWASAYIGKGIAEGVYSGTAVPAERALAIIEEVKVRLNGC